MMAGFCIFSPELRGNISTDSPWCDIGSTLFEMRKNKLMCDVQLVASDYEYTELVFPVHSVILAASCKLFYRLFITNQSVLDKNDLFQLTELDSHALDVVVNFIYGKYPDSAKDYECLYKASNILGVSAASLIFKSYTQNAEPEQNPEEDLKNLISKIYEERWNESLKCPICNQVFSTKSAANEHLVIVHQYTSCTICHKKHVNKYQEIQHLTKYHSKDLQCNYCKEDFHKYADLIIHLFTEHSSRRHFVCIICGKNNIQCVFASQHFLENHEIIATYASLRALHAVITILNVKHFTELSDAVMNNIMNKEWREKWLITSFPCYYCGVVFNHQSDLILDLLSHLETDQVHLLKQDQKEYECLDCSETFYDTKLLRSHRSAKHVSDRFVCSVCKWHAPSSKHLEIHMNKHTGQKPYHCTVCPAKFKQPHGLKYHKMSHSDETNYNCELCGHEFKYPQSLNFHMKRTHDRNYIRPFACSVCSYRAHTRKALRDHMTSHTNERNFNCSICDKSFLVKHHLKRHQANVHYDHPSIAVMKTIT